MPMICPTGTAQLVPQADTDGESVLYPIVTSIPTNQFSIPIATGNVEDITVSVDPASNAGSVEVYCRPVDTAAWRLLDTIDTSGGANEARYQCPIGQIRMKVLVVATAKVYVQGRVTVRS